MAHFVNDWSRDAQRMWGMTALILLMLAGGAVYVLVQHRRERRLGRDAIRLARQQSLMIENEWIGMLRVKNRTVTWANLAVPKLLGYPMERIVGSTTRMCYWDVETYERIGTEGYARLAVEGSFHTQVKMKSGADTAVWVDLSGVALDGGESAWTLVDITNLKHRERAAQHEALHDPLTGLANRRLFEEKLKLVRAQSQRQGTGFALCFLDLDGFKLVNDTFGHEAGDEVLRAVAERLRSAVRASDLVARLGGDEFAIVLGQARSQRDVEPTVQRCLEAVRQAVPLSTGESVSVGCSMGIAISTDGQEQPHDLLNDADQAMYEVKREGKGHHRYAGEPLDLVQA